MITSHSSFFPSQFCGIVAVVFPTAAIPHLRVCFLFLGGICRIEVFVGKKNNKKSKNKRGFWFYLRRRLSLLWLNLLAVRPRKTFFASARTRGPEYSAAVAHEEKFLIINIPPIMNVLPAAVVLGAKYLISSRCFISRLRRVDTVHHYGPKMQVSYHFYLFFRSIYKSKGETDESQ